MCLHFVLLSDVWGFRGWVFGTYTALLTPGTMSTQEALGMCPPDAFSTLYLNDHSEFVTTTQFWVSDIHGLARSIRTSAILRASPRVLEYQHSDWSDREIFPTVERLLTSTLLCVSHPAGLMQALFPKGVLRIEFKSHSPCWQAVEWWPVHQQEDMPKTDFLYGKDTCWLPRVFYFLLSWLVSCLSSQCLHPDSILMSHELIIESHSILDHWHEISRKP